MRTRRDRPARAGGRLLLYALAVVAIVVAVLAITEIGPPTSSARTSKETITAQQGVVQSTVSGTGNIAAGTDDTVNFNTSGTLQDVYVHVGQHVNSGQLLADLDPTAAQLSLDQANASLTAAQDNLNCVEGETSYCGSGGSTGSGSSGSGSTGSSSTTSYSPSSGSTIEYASFKPPAGTKPSAGTGKGKTKGKTKGGSGTTVVATKTTPSVTVTVVVPSTTPSKSGGAGASSGSKSSSTPTTTTTSTPSPGSIASAQASVYSAQASVHNAEVALNATKLYAPVSGTIASLSSLTPGQSVSGGSGSSSSSTGSSSSSSGSSGGGVTAGSLGGSSSSSSSSSSGFAEIINTDTLTMTVAFSESDISKVKVGQSATVSLDALAGVQLAAHVSQISPVGTTSSSVVSYDATITLDQNDSQVKPGMSASASVITGQASGVTLPNSAVTGTGSLATVNVLKNGKPVPTQVVVGLRGDSRTQIISGLSAGDQVQVTITLPSLSSTSTTGSSGTGTLGGAGGFGGAGGLGGAGGFGGGGGFFRRAAGGG
jgi:multidrug efflux pump subunit AcrA (membrane-fusion protein)